MKTRFFRNFGSLVLILFILLQGCVLPKRIIEEDDLVYDTNRKSLTLNFNDRNRRSPMLFLKKSFVKESNANQPVTLKVYDVLTMSGSGFNLEDRVFLIIDEVVFPMTLSTKELEHTTRIDESREDVKTSDSTSVSVVTGYSTNNLKITRLHYSLSTEITTKIQEAKSIMFRYYAGPEMATISIKNNKLKKLRQLLAE